MDSVTGAGSGGRLCLRGNCKVQGVLGCSGFFQIVRSSKDFFWSLEKNLG